MATVAPPQHLVLWSRLGLRYDRAELDRLPWDERKLIEWNAFVWPAEDLPLLLARMRHGDSPLARRHAAYLTANASFRRYVLGQLEHRGPLLSRDIQTHRNHDDHRWWGSRQIGLMLQVLNARGKVAVVGRRGNRGPVGHAARWYLQRDGIRT